MNFWANSRLLGKIFFNLFRKKKRKQFFDFTLWIFEIN